MLLILYNNKYVLLELNIQDLFTGPWHHAHMNAIQFLYWICPIKTLSRTFILLRVYFKNAYIRDFPHSPVKLRFARGNCWDYSIENCTFRSQ